MLKDWLSPLLCAGIVSGCATIVERATPQELRAAPGSSRAFATARPYDAAYRKTLEQMKSCYERKLGLFGSSQTTVFGDKSALEAHVSLALSTMFGYKVFATIVLAGQPDGTAVTLYSAGDKPPIGLEATLKNWLDADAMGCPGDAGFNDTLNK